MRIRTPLTPFVLALTLGALIVTEPGQGSSSEAVICSTRAPKIVLGRAGDLSGPWTGSGGGRYWIRQVGSCLWWYGESSNGGKDFTNVFFGTVKNVGSTSTVEGVWADVPRGPSLNSGSLILAVTGPGTIVTRAATGGFNPRFKLCRASC
jgi:hypothetical protein